jgi:5,10-methylenetetrahydrofolate reductase
MSGLLDSLARPEPSVWLEVAPPRGIACESLLSKLSQLRGHVDAINLTDNALGQVKLAGLVFASMVKTRIGLPVVLNFSCRDRNLLALKADLLGAAALEIDAVVALTGDKLEHNPRVGEGRAPRVTRDVNAIGLLQVIHDLNRGDTGEGRRLLKTLPAIVAGGVANPNREAIEREFELLARKAEAGARFVITQPVFERERAVAFAERAAKHDIKVVLGILPVKREAMANYLSDRVTDLSSVREHFSRYAGLTESQARELSIRENLDLMQALDGKVAGFNIMSGGGPSLSIELALEYSRRRGRGI